MWATTYSFVRIDLDVNSTVGWVGGWVWVSRSISRPVFINEASSVVMSASNKWSRDMFPISLPMRTVTVVVSAVMIWNGLSVMKCSLCFCLNVLVYSRPKTMKYPG